MPNVQEFSVVLESHYYGMNGAAIKYTTRNICSDATAKMLEEMARILFPNEEIEIYVIPAQDGCHQDGFWVRAKDNPLPTALLTTFFGAILLLPSHTSQILTDLSTRALNESQIQLNQSQEELNRLQIEQLKQEIRSNHASSNITNEQIQKLVESPTIKQNRNKHFQQLQNDGEITKEKFVAKSNGQIISEKTIEGIDFGKYVEKLQEMVLIKTIEKIHNLRIIKSVNDEEYRDLMWIVEDMNGKEKFGVHMSDEDFYKFHLENVLGLKNLCAKVRYTVHENQIGEQTIKNKEIIVVYSYNDIKRVPLSEGATIESAPLELWDANKDEFFFVKRKDDQKKNVADENQLSLFQNSHE